MTQPVSVAIDIEVVGCRLRYSMEMAENGRIIRGNFKVHFCVFSCTA